MLTSWFSCGPLLDIKKSLAEANAQNWCWCNRSRIRVNTAAIGISPIIHHQFSVLIGLSFSSGPGSTSLLCLESQLTSKPSCFLSQM